MSQVDSYKDFTIGIMINLLIAEVLLLGKTSDFLNISSDNNQEIVGKFIILISGNVLLFIFFKALLNKMKVNYYDYLVLSYMIVPTLGLLIYAMYDSFQTGSNLLAALKPILLFYAISYTNVWILCNSNNFKEFPSRGIFLSFLNYLLIGCMILYVNKYNNPIIDFFQATLGYNFEEDRFFDFLTALLISTFLSLCIISIAPLLIRKKTQ